jgi:hypothetical protein
MLSRDRSIAERDRGQDVGGGEFATIAVEAAPEFASVSTLVCALACQTERLTRALVFTVLSGFTPNLLSP